GADRNDFIRGRSGLPPTRGKSDTTGRISTADDGTQAARLATEGPGGQAVDETGSGSSIPACFSVPSRRAWRHLRIPASPARGAGGGRCGRSSPAPPGRPPAGRRAPAPAVVSRWRGATESGRKPDARGFYQALSGAGSDRGARARPPP